MKFFNLCVEVPEDLERFDSVELFNDNGCTFLLFYLNKKVVKSVYLRDVYCCVGDFKYIIEHLIKHYNYVNFEEFIYGLSKKNDIKRKPKAFSAICRRKKT